MQNIHPNNITELVFILDRSGSMAGLEDDTIGGFNAMIEKQKKEEGLCYVSTVLFDGESQVLHDRLPLTEVAPMTHRDYTARGCTALLDALGEAIGRIDMIHKYIRKEDLPQKTMFVVTTDGQENASRRYDAPKVKAMIESHKELGWEFLFIGANIDAVSTASHYGIDKNHAVDYRADRRGTQVLYEAVNKAVEEVRRCCPVSTEWREEIAKDFTDRD